MKWLSFTPHQSYVRKYVNKFYSRYCDKISGSVLDLGSKGNNRPYFEKISENITEYYSVDLVSYEDLTLIGDGRYLTIKTESIDTIILSEVLEHIPPTDLSTIVDELYRVLRPGGTVLATTPFVHRLHFRPFDYSRFTYYGLDHLFKSAEFKTELITGGGFTELLLHLITLPTKPLLTNTLGKKSRWILAPLHYAAYVTAIIATKVLIAAGSGNQLSQYYINQMIVADKVE